MPTKKKATRRAAPAKRAAEPAKPGAAEPQTNVTINNLPPPPSPGKKKVNWVLVLLMSIFFGWLGVDRFMMGQVGLGILKLITAGGCGIWWVIDIILIATKYNFNGIEWVEN